MRIGIVGLGLIGGSLGMDWVAAGHQVWGVSRNPHTCQQAGVLRAVHTASTDLESLEAHQVEVVVICTPIEAIVPTLRQLAGCLSPQVLVTDVGSVKAEIVEAAESIWPRFVGGHPMGGTEASGIGSAQPGLFGQRPYVLTPLLNGDPEWVDCLGHLALDLGADPVVCDPLTHDQAVAWISHLPVMVSASLIRSCGVAAKGEVLTLAQRLASSGFRDTSRVGGGNPDLGAAMAQFNKSALLNALAAYQQQLGDLIALIEQEDWGSLHQILTLAQQQRPSFVSMPDPAVAPIDNNPATDNPATVDQP
jgi:arogenate dehydrogenase (NADP+)